MANNDVTMVPSIQKYPMNVTKVSRHLAIIISEVYAKIGGILPPIPKPASPLKSITSVRLSTIPDANENTVLIKMLNIRDHLLPKLSPR